MKYRSPLHDVFFCLYINTVLRYGDTSCGVMEDATHFFFHCVKYIGERQVFNDTVREFQPLTINLILFGSENWNIETNMVLSRAIHRYIHASKRF